MASKFNLYHSASASAGRERKGMNMTLSEKTEYLRELRAMLDPAGPLNYGTPIQNIKIANAFDKILEEYLKVLNEHA